jgi:hypothetical protein
MCQSIIVLFCFHGLRKKLREGNLPLALIHQSTIQFCGFGYSSRPRQQVKFTEPIRMKNIIDGLQKIQATVIFCNEIIPETSTDICTIHNQQAITILKSIFLFGELCAQ